MSIYRGVGTIGKRLLDSSTLKVLWGYMKKRIIAGILELHYSCAIYQCEFYILQQQKNENVKLEVWLYIKHLSNTLKIL